MNRPPTAGPEANFYDPGSFDATAYNAGFEDGIAQAEARAASQERPQLCDRIVNNGMGEPTECGRSWPCEYHDPPQERPPIDVERRVLTAIFGSEEFHQNADVNIETDPCAGCRWWTRYRAGTLSGSVGDLR